LAGAHNNHMHSLSGGMSVLLSEQRWSSAKPADSAFTQATNC